MHPRHVDGLRLRGLGKLAEKVTFERAFKQGPSHWVVNFFKNMKEKISCTCFLEFWFQCVY
jgi:hypothetical protein